MARITCSMAALVSAMGLKLPGRKPCAMSRGVQPALFYVFQTEIFAPLLARKSTILGRLL